jgi:hypothetical protein
MSWTSLPNLFNRLCRLRNDSEVRTLPKFFNVFFTKHDVEFIQIFRHATDLHMIALANHNWVKTFAHEH